MKRLFHYICFSVLFSCSLYGQDSLDINGQLSGYLNVAPKSDPEFMAGGRYLPELNYTLGTDKTRQLDFDVGANIYGNVNFHPFDTAAYDGAIKPYRLWVRYSGNQFELRLGLQKINFGSATLLRPLQWFDDIDPRDPLQFSNGVYGLLGRYYFLNNANIWLWTLYGNENPRGFEQIKNNKKIPEFGGRLQLPVPKGEIAISYHHRTADSRDITGVTPYDKIPENRIALDGKWDLSVGLWFEASYVHKSRDLGLLTNQAMIDVGTDYTFGIGSGLNVSIEHLMMSVDEHPFGLENLYHVSASILSFPAGLFDRISGYLFYLWDSGNLSFMINYQHDFNHFTGYIMAYYIPVTEQNLFTDRYIQQLTGPGIRIMAVFNH